MQVLDVLAAEEEADVDHIVGGDERRRPRRVEELAALGPERLDVLEGDGGVGLVDRVEGALVAYVFLRDQGNATPCMRRAS